MDIQKLMKDKSTTFSWEKQIKNADALKKRHDKWHVKHDPNFVAKVGKRQASRIEDGVV